MKRWLPWTFTCFHTNAVSVIQTDPWSQSCILYPLDDSVAFPNVIVYQGVKWWGLFKGIGWTRKYSVTHLIIVFTSSVDRLGCCIYFLYSIDSAYEISMLFKGSFTLVQRSEIFALRKCWSLQGHTERRFFSMFPVHIRTQAAAAENCSAEKCNMFAPFRSSVTPLVSVQFIVTVTFP